MTTTSTSQRAEALAKQFEQAVDDLAKEIESCTDAQWQAICGVEKWTVAGTAHHVGAQFGLELEYLEAGAYGRPMPTYTWDDINSLNDRRAQENSNFPKYAALKQLREGAARMAAFVRGLSDEQLDRQSPLPLANGAMVTTQQLIEGGVLIAHSVDHAASIRAAK